jgi:pentatricopeptide repeat protein
LTKVDKKEKGLSDGMGMVLASLMVRREAIYKAACCSPYRITRLLIVLSLLAMVPSSMIKQQRFFFVGAASSRSTTSTKPFVSYRRTIRSATSRNVAAFSVADAFITRQQSFLNSGGLQIEQPRTGRQACTSAGTSITHRRMLKTNNQCQSLGVFSSSSRRFFSSSSSQNHKSLTQLLAELDEDDQSKKNRLSFEEKKEAAAAKPPEEEETPQPSSSLRSFSAVLDDWVASDSKQDDKITETDQEKYCRDGNKGDSKETKMAVGTDDENVNEMEDEEVDQQHETLGSFFTAVDRRTKELEHEFSRTLDPNPSNRNGHRGASAPPANMAIHNSNLNSSGSGSNDNSSRNVENGAAKTTTTTSATSIVDDVLAMQNNSSTARATRTSKSIFDTILPKVSSNTSNNTASIASSRPVNAYQPLEVFEEYKTAMLDIVHNDRFQQGNAAEDIQAVEAWLIRETPQLTIVLPTFDKATQSQEAISGNAISTATSTSDKRAAFAREIADQRERFIVSSGLTVKQHKMALGALSNLGNKCARVATGAPMEVGWEKIKEAGMVPREPTMSTFLYVVGSHLGPSPISGLGRNSSSSSMPWAPAGSILDVVSRPHQSEKDQNADNNDKHAKNTADLPLEVATFHDLLYQPTEKSISLRVKSLVENHKAQEAEQLLNDMEREIVLMDIDNKKAENENNNNEQVMRLRTYLPVLKAYCDEGHISDALVLFARMRQSPGVILEPENYVLLLASAAERTWFQYDHKVEVDSESERRLKEAGYTHTHGPELFVELIEQMTGNVLTITSASARRLHNAFLKGFEGDTSVKISSDIKEVQSLGAVRPTNERAADDELVISRVTIDDKSALCPRTGARLRLILLKSEERALFLEKLMILAETQFHDFQTSNANNSSTQKKKWDVAEASNRAVRELQRFANFLK